MSIDLIEIFDKQNQLDEKSRAYLLNAIKENNQTGFDYLEYKQALIRLEEMEVEPTLAIKTAYTTATTVGLTREKLLDSAEFYLSILNDEYKQFKQALEKQMEARVHSREKQKSSLEKKRENIRKKIRELEKEENEIVRKLDKMDADTEDARKKIEQTNERFAETLNTITDKIQTDLELLKSHLPDDD